MTDEEISNIRSQWEAENIKLNPPATIESITEAENAIGFEFPSDFKSLYLKINGFNNWDWRSNMFSLWPIHRIVEEYLQDENKNFVGFCDYLINSHQIGFFKDRVGVYKSYDEFNLIATNFQDAIHLVNSDSELLY